MSINIFSEELFYWIVWYPWTLQQSLKCLSQKRAGKKEKKTELSLK
jgi:hypothetical protein